MARHEPAMGFLGELRQRRRDSRPRRFPKRRRRLHHRPGCRRLSCSRQPAENQDRRSRRRLQVCSSSFDLPRDLELFLNSFFLQREGLNSNDEAVHLLRRERERGNGDILAHSCIRQRRRRAVSRNPKLSHRRR